MCNFGGGGGWLKTVWILDVFCDHVTISVLSSIMFFDQLQCNSEHCKFYEPMLDELLPSLKTK